MDVYVLLRYKANEEEVDSVIGTFFSLNEAKKAAKSNFDTKIVGWTDYDTKLESVHDVEIKDDKWVMPKYSFVIHKTQLIR